jgi:anti-sigma B factor antagonist
MEFYYHEVDNNVLIVRADGGLNKETAAQFVAELGKLVDAGLTRIIVDCSDLDYISSYGLSVLVRLHTKLARRGGDVKLAGVRGAIQQVLNVTRVNSLFEIYPDVNRARLMFRPVDEEDEEAPASE